MANIEQNFSEKIIPLLTDWGRNNLKRNEKIDELIPEIVEYSRKIGFIWCGDVKGEFLLYDNGVFIGKQTQNVKMDLEKLIADCFSDAGISPRINNINEVISAIKREYNCISSDFDINPSYINFKNGLFNTKTWVLEEHRQEHYSRIQIPVNYITDSQCPEFDSFLELIAEKSPNPLEMKRTILEMIAYCLTTDISLGKAFILYSITPNTAKSTLINIIVYLVGENNCSKTQLDKLAHNRFAKSFLAHKQLNYFTDLPTTTKITENGILKDLITDKEFVYEPKGFTEQKHRNIIKLLFACNKLPKIKNMTEAFAKRWVLIPFFNPIPAEDIEKNWEYSHILSNPLELEGIVFKCMEALKELYIRGSFTNSSEQEVMKEWEWNNNPVYRFIESKCRKAKNGKAEREKTFGDFKKFLKNNDLTYSKKKTGFTQDLKRLGYPLVEKKKGKKRNFYYMGIKN